MADIEAARKEVQKVVALLVGRFGREEEVFEHLTYALGYLQESPPSAVAPPEPEAAQEVAAVEIEAVAEVEPETVEAPATVILPEEVAAEPEEAKPPKKAAHSRRRY